MHLIRTVFVSLTLWFVADPQAAETGLEKNFAITQRAGDDSFLENASDIRVDKFSISAKVLSS